MTTQRLTVTAAETIHVQQPPEVVFDYTQDYYRRTEWDPAIVQARVLGEDPRRIEVVAKGVGRYVIEYRLFRRGDRTSAAFVDVRSRWLSGGGGSWRYEARDGGTDWTQTNTLELRYPRLLRFVAPLFERQLRTVMRQGMAAAKGQLEATAAASPAA